MNKYHISRTLKPYFEKVLAQNKKEAEWGMANNEKDYFVLSSFSRGEFKNYLDEAIALRSMEEGFPVYSHRILNNPDIFFRLQEINPQKGFVIPKDKLYAYTGYGV